MADRDCESTPLLTQGGSGMEYRTGSSETAVDKLERQLANDGSSGAYTNECFENNDENDEEPLKSSRPTPKSSTGETHLKRPVTEDELLFKLKFAELYPGNDWFEEVATACRANGDFEIYVHVLAFLREFPLKMSEKMLLSRQIRARLEAGSISSTYSERSKNSQVKERKRARRSPVPTQRSDFFHFQLWKKPIGHISAYFGTNVASYFQFLRFLVLLNVGVASTMLLFVLLPQIISVELISAEVERGFFGDLSRTIFFYGAYSNTSITNDIGLVLSYDRPLAYFMTWSCDYILAVFVIVISMYVSYRRIKTSDQDDDLPYASQLFLGWDHSVTSREGSRIRSNTITTQYKETAREEKMRQRRTKRQRFKLWMIRILCNVLSLAVLAGSGYLIYVVAENSIGPEDGVPSVFVDFLEKYQLPVVVSVLKLFIPPVLDFLLSFEHYHPRTQIKFQIARTAIFYVASLIVFLASIFSVSTQCMDRTSNGTVTSTVEKNTTENNYCCWENDVGEQLFQVVILDLVVSLVLGLLFTGVRAALVTCCNVKKIGYKNFDVASFILDLVYGQSLIWLGLYSTPFLALVGFIKLVILFYFNYVLALTCCLPSSKVFRASRSGTFYLFILLVTLFACLLPVTYAVVNLEPSESCGPFKTNERAFQVLTDKLGQSPSWIQDALGYLSTPGVAIPGFIVLMLLVLYYKVKSAAHKREAKELRYHLQFERRVEKRRVFATAQLLHKTSKVGQIDEVHDFQEM